GQKVVGATLPMSDQPLRLAYKTRHAFPPSEHVRIVLKEESLKDRTTLLHETLHAFCWQCRKAQGTLDRDRAIFYDFKSDTLLDRYEDFKVTDRQSQWQALELLVDAIKSDAEEYRIKTGDELDVSQALLENAASLKLLAEIKSERKYFDSNLIAYRKRLQHLI